MNKKQSFLFLVFLLPFLSFSQSRDLWQWSTLSIDKKITPSLSFIFDEELRLQNNLSEVNLFYSNIGAGYKVNKYVKVAGVYRWINKNRKDSPYSSRHRFYADVSFKYRMSPLVFSFRTRIQTQVRDVYSSDSGLVPENYWRNKFDLKLDMNRRFAPYVAAEFRYQFNNSRIKEANNQFDRGRYYIGLDYEINRVNTAGVYYMIQRDYNVNDPETDYVLGIAYSLSL